MPVFFPRALRERAGVRELYAQPFFAAIGVQFIRSHRMPASELQSVELPVA